MALKLMSSGGGSVTLDVPSTASNLAMNVPAAAGTLPYVDSSGILQGVTSGIKFPSTQVSSADANVLDDYEEGTWMPAFTPSSGAYSSVSYEWRAGTYQKIGAMVYYHGSIGINGVSYGSASGIVYISNFPFAKVNGYSSNDDQYGVMIGAAYGWKTTNPTYAWMTAGTSYFYVTTSVAGGGGLPATDIQNGTRIFFQGFYRTTQ